MPLHSFYGFSCVCLVCYFFFLSLWISTQTLSISTQKQKGNSSFFFTTVRCKQRTQIIWKLWPFESVCTKIKTKPNRNKWIEIEFEQKKNCIIWIWTRMNEWEKYTCFHLKLNQISVFILFFFKMVFRIESNLCSFTFCWTGLDWVTTVQYTIFFCCCCSGRSTPFAPLIYLKSNFKIHKYKQQTHLKAHNEWITYKKHQR